MTLRLWPESTREVWAAAQTIRRDRFIRSSHQETLREELRRHISGEIRGRSFLIAGHRGAGKTALVRTVVDELRYDVFHGAASAAPVPMQRPILVKLHGPSLLSDTSDTPPPPPAPPPRGTARNGVTVNLTLPAAPPNPAETAAPKSGPASRIQSALVQITVALYRAVSAEFAESYRSAVEQAIARHRHGAAASAELRERAAQLGLELDSGPEAALLRDYWTRLDPAGWARRGVLWSDTFTKSAPDRGLQEIAALATAAQTFRKCTGVATLTERVNASLERTASVTFAGKADLKHAADKLFAGLLGIGVGVSAALAKAPAEAAAGAALAVAAISATTFSWSAARKQRNERTTEYSFLPDLSVQSLDRDLPLMIDRLHEVGLWPVFVIDEIDKLDSPDDPMIDLMRRLKQLTADYGFFCFLADRDYYDRVQSRVASEVFPLEHTFFTHRMLVAYQANQIVAYLRGSLPSPASPSAQLPRLASDLPDRADDPRGERFAALLLGRVLLHGSALNPTDLIRGLSRIGGAGGSVTETAADIRGTPIYQLQALLQLAIEHALRQPAIAERIKRDPAFTQVAADALYMISRAWWAKCDSVTVNQVTVAEHLSKRLRIGDPGARPGRLRLDQMVSARDLVALTESVRLVAQHMCHLPTLRAAVEPALEFEDALLKQVFDAWRSPLLDVPDKAKPDVFPFRWSADGQRDPKAAAADELLDRAATILSGFK